MLAIIGGTGLYQLEFLNIKETLNPLTPFGDPSSEIIKGEIGGRDILFLARHGVKHQFLPQEINYRANIFALKLLGATQIISISAVGSLQEEIAPGDLAFPSQYFDWTHSKRQSTFFGNGVVAHVSSAQPTSLCLSEWVVQHAVSIGMTAYKNCTYACIQGPRFGTRAESHFLRNNGAHIVGMTNIPECFLAREAQICYATVGVVTDYDCWMDDPSKHAEMTAILALYKQSLEKIKLLIKNLCHDNLPPQEPVIRQALAHAVLTPIDSLSTEQQTWLEVLKK